jgi:hypothetical protein
MAVLRLEAADNVFIDYVLTWLRELLFLL